MFLNAAIAQQEAGELSASADSPAGEVLRSALRGDRASIGFLPRLLWSRNEVAWVSRAFTETKLLVGKDASEHEVARLADDGTLALQLVSDMGKKNVLGA